MPCIMNRKYVQIWERLGASFLGDQERKQYGEGNSQLSLKHMKTFGDFWSVLHFLTSTKHQRGSSKHIPHAIFILPPFSTMMKVK